MDFESKFRWPIVASLGIAGPSLEGQRSKAASWGHVQRSALAAEQLPPLFFGEPNVGHILGGVE